MFNLLMATHLKMEGWRYVWTGPGARCAMTDGALETLKFFVDNLDLMDVRLHYI